MRTNYVKSARKSPGKCNQCGKAIKVGDGYKWIKGRYTGKRIRCGTCPDWKLSEKTGSDKLSTLYAARENVEAELESFDGKDASALKEAPTNAAEEARGVGDEYRESAEAWNGNGPAAEWEEKADQCDSWADELDNAEGEIEDFDEDAAKVEVEDEARTEVTEEVAEERRAAKDSDKLEPSKSKEDIEDAIEEKVEEKVEEKREEWAEEVRERVQNALDALEL